MTILLNLIAAYTDVSISHAHRGVSTKTRRDKTRQERQDNRQALTSTPENAAKASWYSDRPSMSSHLANGMCFWTAPPSGCGGVAGVSIIVERFSRSVESVLRCCHGNWSNAYNEYGGHAYYKLPHDLLRWFVWKNIIFIWRWANQLCVNNITA